MKTERAQKFTRSLINLASQLPFSNTTNQIIELLHVEVKNTLNINSVWLYLHDHENDNRVQLITYLGHNTNAVIQKYPEVQIEGDKFLQEVIYEGKAVYAHEAKLDPRINQSIVEQLGNRTVYNCPITMKGKHLGVLGMGTFGDEGTRDLGIIELDYLRALSHQVATAIHRIHGAK